jgi:hypothetical protein
MNISLLPYLLGGTAKYTTDAQFVSSRINKFVYGIVGSMGLLILRVKQVGL